MYKKLKNDKRFTQEIIPLKCAQKQTADQKTFDPTFVHSNVYKVIATMTTSNTPN